MNHTLRKRLRLFTYGLGLFMMIGLVTGIGFVGSEKGLNDAFQELFNRNYSVFALNIPKHMEFAGESVPVEFFDVRESLDRELLVNTYWQSQTLLFIKRANRYFPVIEEILHKNEVPDDFKYIALAESGLMHVTSPVGAVGFWQFMKNTAKEYGLEVNNEVDERYNIEKATEAACAYFKKSYKKYGNWTMVAASYNNGMRGLDIQVDRQEEQDYYDLLLNDETGRYLFRIISLKLILSDPGKYGFHFRTEDLYPPFSTTTVMVDTAIKSMVDFASQYDMNYKMLKYFNPWLRETYLSNENKRTYQILIPTESFRTSIYENQELISD